MTSSKNTLQCDMQKFQFSEVVEFLNNNLDSVFNYGMPTLTNDRCCLMGEFFKDKGFRGHHLSVSYDGKSLETETGGIVAQIEDFKIDQIGDIHKERFDTGRKILERLRQF